MSDNIELTRHGAVQVIRINRPEKKNALTRSMYAAMSEALRSGDADPEIRCHVFLGVPGAFSAGNDLADFLAIATGAEGGAEVWDFLMALVTSELLMLSRAESTAVGIDTTLHLHCDLTFATPRTSFHTPFTDLGLVPEAGSSLIAPLLIGRQQAFALLAMGEPFPAQKALELGIIYRVVDESDLETEVLAAAQRVAAKPPQALKIARDLMRAPRAPLLDRVKEESEHFRDRLKSEEARAALMAFMSRKK